MSLIYFSSVNEYKYIRELIDFKRYANAFIIYFLLKNAIGSKKQAETAIAVLIMVLIVSAIITVLSFTFSLDLFATHKGRIGGIVNQPNIYGIFLTILIPLLLAYKPDSFPKTIVKIVFVMMVFVNLIQTGSRGAYLSVCAILLLMLLKSKQKYKALLTALIVGLLILVSLSFISIDTNNVISRITGESYRQRQNVQGEIDLNTYSGARLQIWAYALRLYAERPIFGYGYNSFYREAMHQYAGKKISAHNKYIDVLFTLGFPGFFLFIAIYFSLFNFIRKNRIHIYVSATYYSIIGYSIAQFFTTPATSRYLFWILLAIICRYIDLSKRDSLDENHIVGTKQ